MHNVMARTQPKESKAEIKAMKDILQIILTGNHRKMMIQSDFTAEKLHNAIETGKAFKRTIIDKRASLKNTSAENQKRSSKMLHLWKNRTLKTIL